MIKGKQCSGTKGYACGKSCISVKKVCRKEGLAGQSIKIMNKFEQQVKDATGGANSFDNIGTALTVDQLPDSTIFTRVGLEDNFDKSKELFVKASAANLAPKIKSARQVKLTGKTIIETEKITGQLGTQLISKAAFAKQRAALNGLAEDLAKLNIAHPNLANSIMIDQNGVPKVVNFTGALESKDASKINKAAIAKLEDFYKDA